MKSLGLPSTFLLCVALLTSSADAQSAAPEAPPAGNSVAEVIYGHKDGLALTFDVAKPQHDANGAGILFMVSGGWHSRWSPPEQLRPLFEPFLNQGYTVFAVRHGSSPKYGIPDAVADVTRSVRYIRQHAEDFGIDPDRLGVMGISSGGHLALMLGTASDAGMAAAVDETERQSSRVAAVVAFVAPTDLRIAVWEAPESLPAYKNFPALNLDVKTAGTFSPLLHASQDDPPILLIAGDQDQLVPIQHSEKLNKALDKAGATTKLIVIEGAGHGFNGEQRQRAMTATLEWFDKHLLPK